MNITFSSNLALRFYLGFSSVRLLLSQAKSEKYLVNANWVPKHPFTHASCREERYGCTGGAPKHPHQGLGSWGRPGWGRDQRAQPALKAWLCHPRLLKPDQGQSALGSSCLGLLKVSIPDPVVLMSSKTHAGPARGWGEGYLEAANSPLPAQLEKRRGRRQHIV